MSDTTHRGSVAALAVAGAAFIAYPVLRPYAPETGMEGARAFAGSGWLVAHTAAMVGFVLVALVLRAWTLRSPWSWHPASARRAELTAWLAAAFLLPYYGAETFGLRAMGRYAADQQDAGVLEIADAFRLAPFEATTFGIGLVLLAVVGVLLVRGLWPAGGLARIGGVLTGLGLVLFLPQFFGTPGARIGHGILLGLGLLVLSGATAVSRQPARVASREPGGHRPALAAPPTATQPAARARHGAGEG